MKVSWDEEFSCFRWSGLGLALKRRVSQPAGSGLRQRETRQKISLREQCTGRSAV